MTFNELSYIFLEKVFRLDYQDDEEWDSWKKAHAVTVGNPPELFSKFIEEQLLKGADFDDLCEREKKSYRSNLPIDVLNPPAIFI